MNRPKPPARLAITALFAVVACGLSASAKPYFQPAAPKVSAEAIPRCSATDNGRNAVREVNGYIRWCGPARALVSVNGKTYRIRGGFCTPKRSPRLTTPRRRLQGIAIGALPAVEGKHGRAVSFWWHHISRHAETVTIDDSVILVPGWDIGASGTVVIRKGLKGGSFDLYGRDASGPTGPRVTGRWTC